MATMYYDKDADLKLLKDKTIGIIGYGSQGHAQAQNLRDSGVTVIVSELPGTANYTLAVAHGFKPVSAADVAKKADIIQMLVPDELQARVYREAVAPEMKKDKTLVFSHGFNIHFGQIVPPADVDVIMIAPKGPGHLVRSVFEEGGGVPNLIAIFQNASGKAKQIALAYSKGIGGTRAGVLETTFAEETETDLFGEQAVLCGGVSELITAGFDTLVEAGYQPEIAYFEVCHELKLIMDLIYNYGIQGMRERVSDTATYGDLSRGKRIITDETRAEMKKMLEEIQTGQFAREWTLENMSGRMVYNSQLNAGKQTLIEKVGAELRAMMPFLKKG